MKITNQSVIIFGETGSLGKTLINRLFRDNELIIFSRDEAKHWAIHKIYSIFRISIKEKLKNIFISHIKLINVIKKIQKDKVCVNYHDVNLIKDLITYFYNNNKI